MSMCSHRCHIHTKRLHTFATTTRVSIVLCRSSFANANCEHAHKPICITRFPLMMVMTDDDVVRCAYVYVFWFERDLCVVFLFLFAKPEIHGSLYVRVCRWFWWAHECVWVCATSKYVWHTRPTVCMFVCTNIRINICMDVMVFVCTFRSKTISLNVRHPFMLMF